MPALRCSVAVLLPLALIGLAACDGGGARAPGGVSEGEAKALEDAAEMLDEQRSLPPEALPPEALPAAAAPAEMTGDSAATAGQ